jgi:hypothetical protein
MGGILGSVGIGIGTPNCGVRQTDHHDQIKDSEPTSVALDYPNCIFMRAGPGIMPLGFSPAPTYGIHYPSVIVEVTPDEYERIQAKELELPQGWTVSDPLTGRSRLRISCTRPPDEPS